MSRNDWIGVAISAIVHLGLIAIFLLVSASAQELTAGYVEVEFGDFSQGRPIQRATEPTRSEAPEEPTEAENLNRDAPEQAEESKPVDLPDQPEIVQDAEQIRSPEAEEVAPDQPTTETISAEEDVVAEEPTEAEAGQSDASSGAESGDEGVGAEEEKAAPYVLEGIDRIPMRTRLPDYDEKVNAIIQVRITVDPRGRIVRVLPLRKGNPTLEQAVMQALRQWLFNPLGPGAPQENQTGTITFRFKLR